MNYHFKFAYRQLLKNKLIVFGSVFSLIMGVLCPYIIFLWVQSEVTADQFHAEYDNIHIVAIQQNVMAKPRPTMATNSVDLSGYTEVEKTLGTRTYSDNEIKLIFKGAEFFGKGMVVDSTFFDFFDFKIIQGESTNLLHAPSQVVLTEGFAQKMFGDQMAVGEVVKLEADNEGLYTVAAVLKIPSNSSIQFDFLVPTHSQKFWGRMGVELLLVNDSFDKARFEERFTTDIQSNPRSSESVGSLFPFSDIYLENPFNHSLFTRSGDRNNIYVISIIALIILAVSLVNFTNLQVTKISAHIKSTSIKMINGASKADLLIEAFIVNIIYAVFATMIGVLLLYYSKSYLENLLDKKFEIEFFTQLATFFLISIVFTSATLLYSARQLSSSKTSLLLKQSSIGKIGLAKKGVTVVQFVCAIVLMFSSLVIYQQFKYLTTKDLGYDSSNIVSIKLIDEYSFSLPREEIIKKRSEQKRDFQLVHSTVASDPSLMGLSQGEMPLAEAAYPMSWKLLGGQDDYTTNNLMSVDPAYSQLLKLEVLEGRFFSDSLDQNRDYKLVINEAAKAYFNIQNIGEARIANKSWGEEEEPFTVIGVVKDFHYEHLSKKVQPLMLMYMQNNENNFLFRLNPNRVEEAMVSLERLNGQINPGKLFEYTSLQNEVQLQYEKEKRLSVIILVFTSVAFIISIIGLFTLSLYDTQRRVKEVGVRRVLGASVKSLVSLLTFSFIKWVFLALIIGLPIAYIGADVWLSDFANRIDIGWGILVITCISVIAIAFLTVVSQTVIAARKNPVDSLRYE